ncbi:MAG: carbohydrate ABC transporter permease [Actinobacteria bacterium]|nr:carbohydrate ABC transporter permease [Actinomycetota bacterium]
MNKTDFNGAKHKYISEENLILRVKNFFASLLKHSIMIIAVLITIYPIYFMIMTSFKTKMDYVTNKIGLPKEFILTNFTAAFEGKTFLIWFMNSVIMTVGSVIISTMIAAIAAYAFSRIRFIGKEKIFNFVISLMVIPPIVMVIPLFVVMVKMKLVNTYFGAIVIYTGLLLPFSIYLLRNFFITIPESIVESAMIDGCSRFKAFTKIVLPISAPALITLIIVNALWVWNELLIALIFLQRAELRTLMVGLSVFRGRYKIDQPVLMAGLFTATLPMLLLYLFGQRFFIRGLVAGSLKGE